jgi:hypothetical protein
MASFALIAALATTSLDTPLDPAVVAQAVSEAHAAQAAADAAKATVAALEVQYPQATGSETTMESLRIQLVKSEARRLHEEAAYLQAKTARVQAEAARLEANARVSMLQAQLLNSGVGATIVATAPSVVRGRVLLDDVVELVKPMHPAGSWQEHSVLHPKRGAMFVAPASVDLVLPGDLSVGASFDQVMKNAKDAVESAAPLVSRHMLHEEPLNPLAVAALPRFVERVPVLDKPSAINILGHAALRARLLHFDGNSLPLLAVRAKLPKDKTPVPGFNGQVQSMDDDTIDEAVHYAAMDMVRVFFPGTTAADAEDDSDMPAPMSARRFYSRPPLSYAIVAFAHMAYVVAVEMVGKLLVAPVCQPFFLGSPQHHADMNALPLVTYDGHFDIPPDLLAKPWQETPDPMIPLGARVSWLTHGGTFYKLVRGEARSAEQFYQMHRAYKRLADVLAAATATERPAALPAWVRLQYGSNEVLVTMPAVEGKDAKDEHLLQAGPIQTQIAEALVWLARRGLVYSDLGGRNVMVRPHDARATVTVALVDFDDCIVCETGSVLTEAAYTEALQQYAKETRAAMVSGTAFGTFFAEAYALGGYPTIRSALQAAFARANDAATGTAP